ncbi:hypothetical protein JB92DRAFT_3128519 [Gautieria morchelliformis]|nr:hypothetical protein JB92DRAFT_3128519 [Gautieria morchelliformis]
MVFVITKCTRTTKPVTLLSDRRRFSALAQSLGDISLATVDVHIHDNQAKPSNDNALFEPFSAEYVEKVEVMPQLPLQAAASTPRSANPRWKRSHRVMRRTGLAELVSSGDFARAENLRAELLEANIQIQRDLVYANAALHAWQTKPVEERTEAFYTWFSLMPNATIGQIRQTRLTLFDMKRSLFSDPTDLNTIACFGLVASRKGFANFVCPDTLAHVTRFAAPRVSSAFFDECEKAARAFYARFKEDTKDNSAFSIWDAENYHNTFVRTLCLAGHLDDAVDRLSYVLGKEISIAPFTWVIFLETLAYVGREDLLDIVRNHRATATKGISDHGDSKPARDSLSATFLSQKMANYINSGMTYKLDQLREEMTQTSVSSDLWAAAQMKYYHDIAQHIVVLRQFMQYYTCVGIQKELVDRYTQKQSPWYQRSFDKEHPSLPLVKPPPIMGGRKRWPSTHTIAMVWQSIVTFAQDIQSLGQVYRHFLDYWDRYSPSTSTNDWSVSPQGFPNNIRFQYPPIMKPDTVHFHVFLTAFARLSGTDVAMQVMSDMQARSIRPDAHNWTVLSGKYAGFDIKSAERILSRMESTVQDKTTLATSSARKGRNRTLTGPLPRPANWIPGPTLVTYTAILRGLIDQGKLEEARQFEVRMKEAGYVTGSDEHTESVLELLRERESTPRIPWHQRASWRPGKN